MPRCTLKEIVALQNIITKTYEEACKKEEASGVLYSQAYRSHVPNPARISYLLGSLSASLTAKKVTHKACLLRYLKKYVKSHPWRYSSPEEAQEVQKVEKFCTFLKKDLEEMPLFIGDGSILESSVADWRLRILGR